MDTVADGRVLELAPEPESVPLARRFVRTRLAGHLEDVVDAAEMCGSELVTNAVLHARTDFQLRVDDDGDIVRLEVRDRSTLLPRRLVHTVRSATGRGMELIGHLAESWGVDLLEDGAKIVWCHIPADPQDDREDEPDASAVLAGWSDDGEPVLGQTEHTGEAGPGTDAPPPDAAAGTTAQVVLVDYPVRLGIRAREHSAGMLRECALLVQTADSTSAPDRLVALAQSITANYSGELGSADQQRTEAFRQGLDTVDIRYPVLPDAVSLVRAWRAVMAELDSYAVANALLTMATPRDLDELNAWIAEEFIRQSEGAAPRPWTGGLD